MLHRFQLIFPDITVSALILLPVIIFLNKEHIRNTCKSAFYYLLALYFCAVYSVVGLPDLCYIRYYPNINLHLFTYMFSAWDTTLLNVILFLPFGFMLPILWTQFHSIHATVCAGFIASLIIEFAQIFTYRASDINDLITNTAGAFAGWIVAKILANHLPKDISDNSTKSLRILTAFSFGIMFFIHPLISKCFGM